MVDTKQIIRKINDMKGLIKDTGWLNKMVNTLINSWTLATIYYSCMKPSYNYKKEIDIWINNCLGTLNNWTKTIILTK